jgi:small GTP-binding protein
MKSPELNDLKEPITKILLVGLDNGGKTSIAKCLRGIKGISSFNSPMPTKHASVLEFEALNSRYAIWDLGGQKAYHDEYLKDFDNLLKGTQKIIYVIDVQDVKRYNDALGYLKKIIDAINKQNNFEFSLFLHKYDPDLEFDKELNQNAINDLIKKIKDIFPSGFNYSISKTSIYATFEKYLI